LSQNKDKYHTQGPSLRKATLARNNLVRVNDQGRKYVGGMNSMGMNSAGDMKLSAIKIHENNFLLFQISDAQVY
jgi:hypothetical protein